MVEDAAENRQWHVSELADAVRAAEIAAPDKPDNYVVQYALSLSQQLVSLKRMIWGLRSVYPESASSRLDRSVLIEQVLTEVGRPLSNAELKERVDEIRGTGQYFYVVADGNIVRVGRGKWGLRSRDIPWSEAEVDSATETLYDALVRSGQGIFPPEIVSMGILGITDGEQAGVLASLAALDPRFALTPGGVILYLRQWNSPRRYTIKRAVRELFSVANTELTRESVVDRLEEMLGHVPDSIMVSTALSSNPTCEYDADKLLWKSI